MAFGDASACPPHLTAGDDDILEYVLILYEFDLLHLYYFKQAMNRLSMDLRDNLSTGLTHQNHYLTLNGRDSHVRIIDTAQSKLYSLIARSVRPLNTIGLPYYDQQLLSSWTPQFEPTNLYYPPPVKIPPQILNTMKMNDNVAYAALPKELKGRRNVMATGRRGDHGRFRSGKRTNDVSTYEGWVKFPYTHNKQAEPDTPTFDSSEVPRLYRKVEIEYSKFGVEKTLTLGKYFDPC